MSKSARVHFVEMVSSRRTVCGVLLDNGADERLPLVFGDLKLWSSCADLGRCCRCSRWTMALDAKCVACAHRKGDHCDGCRVVHENGSRCPCNGFVRELQLAGGKRMRGRP
jgi:hypothetical protein